MTIHSSAIHTMKSVHFAYGTVVPTIMAETPNKKIAFCQPLRDDSELIRMQTRYQEILAVEKAIVVSQFHPSIFSYKGLEFKGYITTTIDRSGLFLQTCFIILSGELEQVVLKKKEPLFEDLFSLTPTPDMARRVEAYKQERWYLGGI